MFASRYGTELDAANVRRALRTVVTAAGLEASEWTPRELRHSFVSLLSSYGMRADRGHRAPSGPCKHESHREGLPQRASAGLERSGRPWMPCSLADWAWWSD